MENGFEREWVTLSDHGYNGNINVSSSLTDGVGCNFLKAQGMEY